MLFTIIQLIILTVFAIISIIAGGTVFALFGDVLVIGCVICLIHKVTKFIKKKKEKEKEKK